MHARYLIAIGALCGIVACGGSSLDDGSRQCRTTLAYETGPEPGYSSPSAGSLLLQGSFYVGESVTLYYSDNAGGAHNESGTLTASRTSLSYGGLPSGTRTYAVYVSCAADIDEAHPWVNFTIM